jgi:hypothetical protein
MSLWQNIKKRGLKDLLNPLKWKVFVRSQVLRALKKEYPEMQVPEYQEQIAYRMSRPDCRKCVTSGECHHCGCVSPDLFYEADNWCSGNEWEGMIPAVDWNQYKEDMNIVVNPDYITQVKKYGRIINF